MTETDPLGPDTEMATVRSTDGPEIAFERTGNGPPLVLVHGRIGDHRFWDLSGVRPAVADHFTMYAMDRRGCGKIEVLDSYAKERERIKLGLNRSVSTRLLERLFSADDGSSTTRP